MERVAILTVTCNRREKLLQCLATACNQLAVLSSDKQYSFDIFLVDDASRDGTAEAVREKFPQVSVIRNSERQYLNRSLFRAWEAAGEDYDFYLWMWDDVILRDNALFRMLDTSVHLGHRAIIVGSVSGSEKTVRYGGRSIRGLRIIEPDMDIPIPCDVFDGCLVLVPASVFKTIGMNDSYFIHGFGDYDYGVRALDAGLDSVIAPGVYADTDHVPETPSWKDSSLTFVQRCRGAAGPFGEQFVYNNRSRNLFYAVYSLFRHAVKVIFLKVSNEFVVMKTNV